MYKKGAFILIFLTILFINGNAQKNTVKPAKFAEKEKLDNARLECIYEYTVTDPDLKETRHYFDILQMGNKYSKYWSYNLYRIDSVVYKMDIHNITTREAGNIYAKFEFTNAGKWKVIKNYLKNNIVYIDRIPFDNYVYEDSISWNWILDDKTAFICGYNCMRAKLIFRGRHWTAWYTPDISISDGPWKFSGLPGLILKIEDSKKEHIFEAVSIRKSAGAIENEKITQFKTTRTKFNNLYTEYANNPGKYFGGNPLIGKDTQGREMKVSNEKRFYNPVEKE